MNTEEWNIACRDAIIRHHSNLPSVGGCDACGETCDDTWRIGSSVLCQECWEAYCANEFWRTMGANNDQEME